MVGQNEPLISQYIPMPRVHEVDRVRLAAPPEEVWRAVRKGKMAQPLFARALFALRVLPEAFAKIVRGEKPEFVEQTTTIDDITKPGSGFQILGETENREVVVGSVGQWWHFNIPFTHVEPKDFASFNAPGYGKLAWNIRIDPSEFGGTWLSLELRVTTTDEKAWRQFQHYWLLIGRFSRAIRRGALQTFKKELGTMPDKSLPITGDEVLEDPKYNVTISKTIEAPPEAIWPWLMQMGCRRAGWYSIDFLDNAGISSADRILPEFQSLKVGDILPATPKGEDGFAVLGLEENKWLLLGSPSLLPFNKDHVAAEPPFQDTWAFYLEPIGSTATRLITRVRASYEPSLKMNASNVFIGTAHQIMQKAQLKNLKRRAESEFARPSERS